MENTQQIVDLNRTIESARHNHIVAGLERESFGEIALSQKVGLVDERHLIVAELAETRLVLVHVGRIRVGIVDTIQIEFDWLERVVKTAIVLVAQTSRVRLQERHDERRHRLMMIDLEQVLRIVVQRLA